MIPAVRGQLDDKGKPLMVRVPCSLLAGHGGDHGNEIGHTKGDGAEAFVIRGGWK
jgi:hypothetical protein